MINENVSFQTVEYMQQRIEELHTENLQLKMDAVSIAADERAKIVAWLRDDDRGKGPAFGFAHWIEKGDHLK